jgi:hypothetical protein
MENHERNYYVYAWLRPCGSPFYIGKGKGNRSSRIAGARRNPLFLNIVDKIRGEGEEPSVVRLAESLSEAEAFDLEAHLIRLHGRRDNGTGILANMTDGGEGASGANLTDKQWAVFRASKPRGTSYPASRRASVSASLRMLPPRSRSKSGLKGVSYTSNGKWFAQIVAGRKHKHLGRYDSPEEAARAYDAAAIATWGAGNCYLNFPPDSSDDRLVAAQAA